MNTPVASVPSPGLPPEAVAVQERMEAAMEVLDAWWADNGAACTSAYEDVYRAVLAAATAVKTTALRRRLDSHAATGRRFTRTSLLRTPVRPGARRQPRRPSRRRPVDRVEQAMVRAVVQPWWAEYGEGWCQEYRVVFGIVRSILRSGTTAEDLAAALALLGPRGMPVGAGTVRIALQGAARTRTAEAARARLASYRTADAYTQREM